GERYWLGHFVVMPNHVHLLVRPIMEHGLSHILHTWKTFTARKINLLIGEKGQLWQHESFDHIVRDEHQLEKFSDYIETNPARAKLKQATYRLGYGSSVRTEDERTEGSATRRVAETRASRRFALLPEAQLRELGLASLRNGEAAVVTLAAGAGSRWTQGAGVVK